ncbi:TlpA disulfide reductase family protein [Winkia sp. UMB3158]|uniref:Thioredoxin domain-containing protein n=2 Tax=Winkia neuii TaxID=33007 RepID=K0YR19_9ACTO|nr:MULTISPECIES: TlpA disulfide reductase family protein [Winkia]MDK8342365.1 TlpA disulfide reductase family protein [Winkia sp. UMB3164B]OFT37709.1 hypothetical protein HMPREF3163_08085 [Actinomyces sp. HMSC08A01]PLB79796.1 TlpA family protein disulfide reductase [Actinomyces sp. UMB0138]PMC93778.1 TlpA family protein disulfide reductase [Actinomyces sp. UMB0918]EJZ85961.1 hypothetical protein HMPREF9240_01434 [Winkia neuii BV029A5]
MASEHPIDRIRNSSMGNLVVIAIAAVAIVGAVVFFATGFGSDKAQENKAGSNMAQVQAKKKPLGPAPKLNEQAPKFQAKDLDGKDISLAELRGKPVWLVFGASWCAACRAEAPDINEAAKRYGNKVNFVSINAESAKDASDYAKKLGLAYPVIADEDTQLSASYRVSGIPAHFVIDAQGKLVATPIGAVGPEQIARNVALAQGAR